MIDERAEFDLVPTNVQPSPIKKRNISQFHLEKREPMMTLNYEEFDVPNSRRPCTSKNLTFKKPREKESVYS